SKTLRRCAVCRAKGFPGPYLLPPVNLPWASRPFPVGWGCSPEGFGVGSVVGAERDTSLLLGGPGSCAGQVFNPTGPSWRPGQDSSERIRTKPDCGGRRTRPGGGWGGLLRRPGRERATPAVLCAGGCLIGIVVWCPLSAKCRGATPGPPGEGGAEVCRT